MNTYLEHLPEHKRKQLREITGIIMKAVDPEKVILFGSHATGRWVEHRYTEGGIIYEYISDYPGDHQIWEEPQGLRGARPDREPLRLQDAGHGDYPRY